MTAEVIEVGDPRCRHVWPAWSTAARDLAALPGEAAAVVYAFERRCYVCGRVEWVA